MAHLAHCYFGFDIYGVEVADLRHICDRGVFWMGLG